MTPEELRALLAWALRASGTRSRHAHAARNVVLTVLLAQLLAAAGHARTPQPSRRPPRVARPGRVRRTHHASLSGRRPRG